MKSTLELGSFIRMKRLEKRMSQKELALNAGCHANTICSIENGYKDPSYTHLCLILSSLGFKINIVSD